MTITSGAYRSHFLKTLLALAAAAALAGCTTSLQPAMNPSDVATLKTGKLLINVRSHPVIVTFNEQLAAFNSAFEGPTIPQIMAQYPEVISHSFLTKGFRWLGQNVAAAVPWLKTGPSVEITEVNSRLGTDKMKRETQNSHVDAVAFVQPMIVFQII